MKAVLQRVSEARVTVGAEAVGSIGLGLLVLVCAERDDGDGQADALARKIASLRIFADPAGKMNLSLREVCGAVLLVSQFTLCADTRRGNRPSFGAAAPAERAEALCRRVGSRLAADGIAVQTGRFGAHMAVQSVNDGPVTIWLDTRAG